MKVGLLMAGISFGYKSDRDFRHCFPNQYKNLIEPLRRNHDVECYISTYEHEHLDELRSLYNPVVLNLVPYEGATQLSTRIDCVDASEGHEIDIYIMTRFDIHFNKSFEEFNLDLDKFNVISREGNSYWENSSFVSDTFYVWPKSLHDGVKQALHDAANSNYDGSHMHNFYSFLLPHLGRDNIHFMFDNFQLSGHEVTNCCTKDYADRLRGQIYINEEILERFPAEAT